MAELITGPAKDDILGLVSVQQLKDQKRIVTARENAFIEDCILDAWAYLDGPEGKCRRAVLPQTWRETLYRGPGSIYRLPVHGARAVTKVSAVIAGAAAVDLATSAYRTVPSVDGIDADIFVADGSPLAGMIGGRDTVVIEFTAGWPSKDDVPRVFRRALRLIAAHLYDNREETFGDQRISVVSRSIELGATKLLEKWIVPLDYGRRRSCPR